MTATYPLATATVRLRLDQLAKIRKWTGQDNDGRLAAAAGVDPGTFSRIVRGKNAPSAKFIAGLCAALDARFDDLFEIDAERATS